VNVSACAEQLLDLIAKTRDRLRKFGRARWSFTKPERDSGRLAFGVFNPNDAGLHAQDPPRRIAELKNITSETFNRKIFVQRPDERFRRFENHSIVGGVRDRAATGNRGQPSSAPAVLSISGDGISKDDIASAEVKDVWLPMSGVFIGTPAAGLKETVLLKTTKDSQLVDGTMAAMGGITSATQVITTAAVVEYSRTTAHAAMNSARHTPIRMK